MAALTHAEAQHRAALLTITSYDIELDLDRGPDTFRSRSRVRFACGEPGAGSFAELHPAEVHEASLNGRPLSPEAFADGRIALTELGADNELVVESTMHYSRDGQGLHRAVDPQDGLSYVYGHLFLDAAPRVFACFDQPDLKAPYDVRVRAPQDWTVVGNGAATPDASRGPGWWTLATTQPLATYFVTVCAGPYASVTAEHDGIVLGLHVRASLGERLQEQAREILQVTRQGFDFYQQLFGVRYPFGAYHQVFVPEFNAGAMENPGCVVLRDQMIFRGAATDAERMGRANTVLHEMAHMWFGDLVTMRWWDDLWLNESFAEYMAHRACVAATEFTGAWADFTMMRKTWGHAAERSPSTHPVAGNPPPDAASALHNFDGISYAKGASVLGQLMSYLGQDAFDEGVRAHLVAHAYGNADLADFLAAMTAQTDRDVHAWAQSWLRTSGLDTLAVDLRSDGSRISYADLRRDQPPGAPADRPHALEVAGYDAGAEAWRLPVVLDDDEVALRGLVGQPEPAVVVPDAGSATWATVRLSARTLAALPRELAAIPEPVTRAVVWTALLDGLLDAQVDPRRVLEVAGASWPVETDPAILHGVQSIVLRHLLRRFLPDVARPAALADLDAAARALAGTHRPGTSAYLVASRGRASWSSDEAYLRGLAEGDLAAEPLAGEADLRWLAVTTLARLGLVDVSYLDARHEEDRTMSGALAYLTARAALPGAADKAWAWEQITGGDGEVSRSNYELNALASGFWLTDDHAALTDYAQRYFIDVPALTGRLGEDALSRVAALAFPSGVVTPDVVRRAEETLGQDSLGAAVRREIVDGLAGLRQALASRERYFAD